MRIWVLTLLASLLLLTACTKSPLLERVSMSQANQVVAMLSHHGIEAEKRPHGDNTWSVSVKSGDAVAATELVAAYGMPNPGHTDLGEIFSEEGLVSTPIEERIRHIFGTSQELASTIESIDGVLSARVHVVMPQSDTLDHPSPPPSASALIRYRSDHNIAASREQIRRLIAHGVEGLSSSRVSLMFIPVTPILGGDCNGRPLCEDSRSRLKPRIKSAWIAAVAGLAILSALFFRNVRDALRAVPAALLRRNRSRVRTGSQQPSSSSPAMPPAAASNPPPPRNDS